MHSLNLEQWQRIWDESEIPMALVGRDHRFGRSNRAFSDLVGYPPSELYARTWQSITHPDDVHGDALSANELQTDAARDSYVINKRYLTKAGHSVFVKLHVRAVREADGRFSGYYILAIPIPDYSTVSRESAAVPQPPFRLAQWIAQNPKDALLYFLAAGIILGREGILKLLHTLLAGGN